MLQKISLKVGNSVIFHGKKCVAIATTKSTTTRTMKFLTYCWNLARNSPSFFFWKFKMRPSCENCRISAIHPEGS